MHMSYSMIQRERAECLPIGFDMNLYDWHP